MPRRFLPWGVVIVAAVCSLLLSACASGLFDSKPDETGKAPIERTAAQVATVIEKTGESTGNPLLAWGAHALGLLITGGAAAWARRGGKVEVAKNEAKEFERPDGHSLVAMLRAYPDIARELALLLDEVLPATPEGKPRSGAAA